MKLDTTHMRYLTADDFRVLNAVEIGSKNHELVPTKIIHSIGGLRSASTTNRCIADLAKLSLISKLRNASYDGYRITYNGYDYLALNAMYMKKTLRTLNTQIGVGKESDIYSCTSPKVKDSRVLKIHRLGRTSFRTVRNNRDYLKNKQTSSWMYLSRLAAEKEYEFMNILYSNGFAVPIPYDYSRHCIMMERIEGFTMRQLKDHYQYKKLYSDLMKFIVKLANHGLIHCDFNEFNIMIKERDSYDPKTDDGFVVIDFPQCVSINHTDAAFYFKRDVECIRKFFKKVFNYAPELDKSMLDTDGYGDGFRYGYPEFERDVKREAELDVEVKASGYRKGKKNDDELESALSGMRNADNEGDLEFDEEESDEDYDDEEDLSESEEEEEEEEDHEEENERIIEALSAGVTDLKMDKLGNYILAE